MFQKTTLKLLRFQFSWKTELKEVLGPQNIIEDSFQLDGMNSDFTYKYKGKSKIAITPRSTKQVSDALRILNKYRIPIVPQGGNTGLVGGSIPVNDEVILLLKHMNKIEEFDPNTNVVTLQPGVILQQANDYLKQFDCEMPWDLGSRGTCQMGGNVSTNCGGLNVVKKGLLRAYILGLEVVLANGDILDLKNTNRKDNTGFDLKQLFIGSEGCLGIITQMNILSTFRAKEKKLLFLQLKSYEDVIKTLQSAKKELHDSLYAFEFMEGRIMSKTVEILGLKQPFDQRQEVKDNNYKYYVLIEAQGNNGIDELMENYAQKLVEEELCLDCVFNKNESEYEDLWKIRDGLTEAQGKMGVVLKYDLSMPPHLFESFVQQIFPNRATQGPLNSFYGHVGDGNMHFNIVYENHEQLKKAQAILEPKIFQLVKEMKGSISAEHGIGQNKRDWLTLQKGEKVVQVMRDMKKLFDPNNILNPGKVIPSHPNQTLAQTLQKQQFTQIDQLFV